MIPSVKFFALILLGLLPSFLSGRTIRVQVEAAPAGLLMGEDWNTPTYLHGALQLSGPGDQIGSKAGLYSPLEGA